MTQLTFDNFPDATQADWESLAKAALRGEHHATLRRHTRDGIAVEALYARAKNQRSAPGVFPYTRSAHSAGQSQQGWQIRQAYDNAAPTEANRLLLEELNKGVTALHLILSGQPAIAIASPADLATVLQDVLPELVTISLHSSEQFARNAQWFIDYCKQSNHAAKNIRVAFGADPISALVHAGSLNTTLAEALVQLGALAQLTHDTLTQSRAVCVNASVYHNAGATNAQELGLLLATGKCYVQAMLDQGLHVNDAFQQIECHIPVDADYFTSAAKLRAARTLWAHLANACGATGNARSMRLHALTSRRMLTRYDPWVNILRTTVAAAAAALGGADSLTVAPYDQVTQQFTQQGNESSFTLARRIARNIQIILQEESALHKVVDPLGGSGFAEHLTSELCRLGWEEFAAIDRAGGLATALGEGIVQDKINHAWSAWQNAVCLREHPIVGISEYPNPLDNNTNDNSALLGEATPLMPTDQTSDQLFGKSADQAMHAENVEQLPARCLSEPFDHIRDAVIAHARKAPRSTIAFTAAIGLAADYLPRVSFSQNLLAAGGFSMTPVADEITQDRLLIEFRSSDCLVAVICASPTMREADLAELVERLRQAGAQQVWFAAKPPTDTPHLGDGYIYTGCNAVESLTQLARAMEITLE